LTRWILSDSARICRCRPFSILDKQNSSEEARALSPTIYSFHPFPFSLVNAITFCAGPEAACFQRDILDRNSWHRSSRIPNFGFALFLNVVIPSRILPDDPSPSGGSSRPLSRRPPLGAPVGLGRLFFTRSTFIDMTSFLFVLLSSSPPVFGTSPLASRLFFPPLLQILVFRLDLQVFTKTVSCPFWFGGAFPTRL